MSIEIPIKPLQFAAIVLVALYAVPGGAHLMELPSKMALDRDAYFTVQQIYRGWSQAGFVLMAALAATLLLAYRSRRQRLAFAFAAVGFGLLAVSLGSFFAFVFPVNLATENWTAIPATWETLRARWEYAHAVNATVVFAALMAVTVSVLTWKGEG